MEIDALTVKFPFNVSLKEMFKYALHGIYVCGQLGSVDQDICCTYGTNLANLAKLSIGLHLIQLSPVKIHTLFLLKFILMLYYHLLLGVSNGLFPGGFITN
jgi:hypothetical protein